MRRAAGIARRLRPLAATGILALGLGLAQAPALAAPQVWTVSLSPIEATVAAGVAVTLTATASSDVGSTPYWLEIYDQTTGAAVAQCQSGTSCSAAVTQTSSTTHVYEAFVGGFSTTSPPRPDTVQAVSTPSTITWSGAGDFSDSCGSPTLTVLDGFLGALYGKLRVQVSGTQTTVCYRVDGLGTAAGGSVVVNPAGPLVGLPFTDGNFQACGTAGGNLLPGPHPELSGTEQGQPFSFDSYVSAGATWFCFQLAGFQARVVVPVAVGVVVPVTQNLDTPGVGAPPPAAWPAGNPSATCQGTAGYQQLVDANLAGVQTWLGSAQPSVTQVEVCARIQGVGGGMLAVDASGSPGISPVLQAPANPAGCAPPLLTVANPVPASLAISSTGSNPAEVCLGVAGFSDAVAVGTAGALGVPSASWYPDPGTP